MLHPSYINEEVAFRILVCLQHDQLIIEKNIYKMNFTVKFTRLLLQTLELRYRIGSLSSCKFYTKFLDY